MKDNTVYFKIKTNDGNEIKFLNNLLPSSVIPEIEVIKNAERSLDGTMSVDIINVKTNLKLVFDLLSDSDFQFITNIFDAKTQNHKYPDGIWAEYFDFNESGAKKSSYYYIDDVSYEPFIVEDEIQWRNLTITLIEL